MDAAACRAAVRAFYEDLWNTRIRAACDRLMAEDVAFRGSLGPVRRGREGFWAYVEEVTGALGGYTCEIEALVAEDDVAFAKLRFSGRHDGHFMGFAPTGRLVEWVGTAHFRFRDDRIADLWVLGDVSGLTTRLEADAKEGVA